MPSRVVCPFSAVLPVGTRAGRLTQLRAGRLTQLQCYDGKGHFSLGGGGSRAIMCSIAALSQLSFSFARQPIVGARY